tara:strand:+ start:186 stop:857 length:672 start_codon:yes stop_codon:yes gene_type:complete
MERKIAVFDFDGTIIYGDSMILAAFYNNNIINFLFSSITFIPYLILKKFGLISSKSLKEIFLKKFKVCELFNLNSNLTKQKRFESEIKKRIKKEALRKIYYHKKNGDRIIICTASPNMIIEAFANELNLELIATSLISKNKKWLPLIEGKNCKGLEKVLRLENHLGQLDKYFLQVYGDSIGDKELLEVSQKKFFRTFWKESSFYELNLFDKIKEIIKNYFKNL